MSWISSGLAHLGISTSVQQALTKPLLVAAAPFTGGATLAALPFVGQGQQTVTSLSQLVQQQQQAGQTPSVVISAPNTAMDFVKSPLGIGAILAALYLLTRRSHDG